MFHQRNTLFLVNNMILSCLIFSQCPVDFLKLSPHSVPSLLGNIQKIFTLNEVRKAAINDTMCTPIRIAFSKLYSLHNVTLLSMYVYMHALMYVYIYIYLCMYVCTLCMWHLYIYTHALMYVYIYIFMYVCMYIMHVALVYACAFDLDVTVNCSIIQHHQHRKDKNIKSI